MNDFKFLLDENLSPIIRKERLKRDIDIDIRRIGDEKVPPLSTPDEEILESSPKLTDINYAFIINDIRKSNSH